MSTLPDVRNSDVDDFEQQLDQALRTASDEQLRDGVVAAARYVEDVAEEPAQLNDPDAHTKINNATATFCRVTDTLLKRGAQQP